MKTGNQNPPKDILTTAIWQLHQDLNWGQIQSVVRHAREAATRQADWERKTEALKQCYKELNRAMNAGLDPSVAWSAASTRYSEELLRILKSYK